MRKLDSGRRTAETMKGLVYHGPGNIAWEDRPFPTLMQAGDAIVRVLTTSICGSDLHILKGDVPEVAPGRILGHEGIGIIEEVGTDVLNFKSGDKVLISSITSCGRCHYCRKAMYSHCHNGGWRLGHVIDGTQAECVRIPFADTSLNPLPPECDNEAMVMLSCILPTGMECAALSAKVQPGDIVAIVGAGPVGLAALMTVKLFSPTEIVMIDLDPYRLEASRAFGASVTLNGSDGTAAAQIMELTRGVGVDVAIEAVGTAAAFSTCQAIIAPGGRIANIGVHGAPVELHLEKLWGSNITITTQLQDGCTTPMLLRMVQSGRLDPRKFASHRFEFPEMMMAYDTFRDAAKRHALKVIVNNAPAGR